jgi:hypothetical protein
MSANSNSYYRAVLGPPRTAWHPPWLVESPEATPEPTPGDAYEPPEDRWDPAAAAKLIAHIQDRRHAQFGPSEYPPDPADCRALWAAFDRIDAAWLARDRPSFEQAVRDAFALLRSLPSRGAGSANPRNRHPTAPAPPTKIEPTDRTPSEVNHDHPRD